MSSQKFGLENSPFVVEEHKHQEQAIIKGDDDNDDSRYQQLYSVPTVDTLETQSSLVRPYSSSSANPNSTMISSSTTPVADNNNSAMKSNSKKKKKAPTMMVKKETNEKEFQIPEDSMAVFVRNIAISQRSAFAMRKPPLPSDITSSHPNKISPSMQHLFLIHKLQGITHTRQLAFTPSVGLSADSLAPNVLNNNYDSSSSSSPSSSTRRDGRYRSIDPVKATVESLPKTPPLLSNKKHRLPLRVDVGFPNASTEEIKQKQKEIANETEWEEASPRLIVLVTSDDLGTAAVQDDEEEQDRKGGNSSSSSGTPPFCGPELLLAKERNNIHFSRKSSLGRQVKEKFAYERRVSMLAPPLDATYSRSMGWRPRPFHDRLPGIHYSLVCPMSLTFAVGNIEPLVCSLTLYSFKEGLSGKASEEFWFPAGDWKGRLAVDVLNKDVDLTDSWHQRRHKAIFSHDPIVIPTKDLYIVLQVYKVSHVELAAAYLAGKQQQQQNKTGSSSDNDNDKSHQGASTDSTGLAGGGGKSDKRSMKKFLKKHKGHKEGGEGGEVERCAYRANSVFDNFGTQFLSQLCFGVTNLYPPQGDPKNLTWPQGQIQQNMQLYSYPAQPENQADFVKRLQKIASRQDDSFFHHGPWDSSGDEQHSPMSMTDSSQATKRKKGGGVRRFLSPMRSSKKDLTAAPVEGVVVETDPPASQSFDGIDDTPMVDSTVLFFTSSLDSDFLQAMLYTPPELTERQSTKALPQVLVDASGESAIMLDPKNSTENLLPQQVKKRSDLVRLPCRSGGGGEYAEVSDLREVLFLPPRPGKNYSVDVPPSYRSLFNLLYLYPRLLTRQDKAPSDSNRNSRYSVRVRLIQSVTETNISTGFIETRNNVLGCFHNPAPWGGPSMLKSVYTRIPGDNALLANPKTGIPMRDEFKLRLPMVLDGNYFLHFSLFSVDLQDDLADDASGSVDGCGISTHLIAETSIPLSSSSTRDPASGSKVTTIIPNACHRLKLGDFQLQVESRLISSVHVSDPAVATALREFPFVNDGSKSDGQRQEMAIHRAVSRSSSVNAVPGKVSYSDVFSRASGSVLTGHFQPLLVMHLSNLVNLRKNRSVSTSEKFLTESMYSFLEICRQVKANFAASYPDLGKERFQAFIKIVIDSFDESCLHSAETANGGIENDDLSETQFEPAFPSIDPVYTGDNENEEDFDGGAVRKRKKDSLGDLVVRITKTFSAWEAAETPFSRVAYGASKTDRMRLEAELDNRTHLVDDDSTDS